jgi:Ca2+-binding EF-hand superfamily protein
MDQPQLPADVEAEFRKIFDDYDTEGSGAIAVSDFPLIAKDLGEPITDEEAHFIQTSIDPEGTGVVAFNDFIRWWRQALI